MGTRNPVLRLGIVLRVSDPFKEHSPVEVGEMYYRTRG